MRFFMPSASQSGPRMKMEMVKPQRAAPPIHPTWALSRPKCALSCPKKLVTTPKATAGEIGDMHRATKGRCEFPPANASVVEVLWLIQFLRKNSRSVTADARYCCVTWPFSQALHDAMTIE